MLPQQLLHADILDILFEGRNKEYGAYTLRKGYNSRLKVALVSTAVFISVVIAFISYTTELTIDPPKSFMPTVVEVSPVDPPTVKKIDPIKPPKPPSTPKPKPPSVVFLIPTIVKENIDIKKDVPPPDKLDNNAISNISREGTGSADIVRGNDAPVASNAPEVIKKEDEMIYRVTEIESTYPGGKNAWMRFLLKTFRYPSLAEENGIAGSVVVQFIVDKEGNVSDVKAISGPEELMIEAVRVISKSGKWTPAMQNGRKVKSYKSQAIVFRLSE